MSTDQERHDSAAPSVDGSGRAAEAVSDHDPTNSPAEPVVLEESKRAIGREWARQREVSRPAPRVDSRDEITARLAALRAQGPNGGPSATHSHDHTGVGDSTTTPDVAQRGVQQAAGGAALIAATAQEVSESLATGAWMDSHSSGQQMAHDAWEKTARTLARALDDLDARLAAAVEVSGRRWERQYRTLSEQHQALRATASWLLKLKDGPRDTTYEAAKVSAWEVLRTALDQSQHTWSET
jgi:hypothetical protein